MARIRAFVGHSFLPQDVELVRKFTDYFDTLKRGALDFEWVHATAARPEDVSDKVLELIEGKNLFIGICTRNERVAKDHQFRPTWVRGRVSVKGEDLAWKTSDWIIQEIGLAIGRDMKLCLLLENNVRMPGGLQSNIEYISFNRDAPEQAFVKILEMMSTIEPNGGSMAEKRGGDPTAATVSDEDEKEPEEALGDPDASWSLGEYKHQFMMGLLIKDEARTTKVSDAYLATVNSGSGELEGEWKAFCSFFRLTWTDHGSLEELKSLAKNYGNNSSVQEYIARGYLHYDDLEHAKEHFRTAIECSANQTRKIDLLGDLALALHKRGSSTDIPAIVAEMRILVNSREGEDLLLSKLTELSGWYKDDVLKTAMLERELTIDPTNTGKRFQLAYLYSSTGKQSLAMFHYEKIPSNERDSMTWNNLGVVYQSFSLVSKSVAAYRKASDKGETLAMSNLAYKLMESGFLSEAKDMIEDAQKRPNYHDNVASALVRLKEIPEKEEKARDEKLDGANVKSSFLSHVGEYVWRDAPKSAPSSFTDSLCKLAVSVKDDVFAASGTYSTESKSDLVYSLTESSPIPKIETFSVEYRGRFVGGVIIGEKSVKTNNASLAARSIFSAFPSKSQFIIVLPEGASDVRALIGDELVELVFKYNA